MLLVASHAGWAADSVLLGWDFAAYDGLQPASTATTVETGVLTSDITRGAGSQTTTNGGIPLNGHMNVLTGSAAGAWNHADLSAAKTAQAYLQLTLTPASGYAVNLTTLHLSTFQQSTNDPDATLAVEYSLDDFATAGTLIGSIFPVPSAATTTALPLSGITALQSLTTKVTFRLWAYHFGYWEVKGLGGVAGDDVAITGSTTAIPHLVFAQQPSHSSSATSLQPDITLEIRDSGNSLVTSSTTSVTLDFGTNPSGGTLSGTTTVNAVGGVATFPGLSIDKVGTGYTLSATAIGISGATSTGFNITLGPSSRLDFIQQPTNSTSRVGIAPGISVQVLDAGGNLTASTAAVTLAIGNNPSGGSLTGTKTVNAVAGIATFADLSINNVGNGYTLTATSAGLSGTTSTSFDVSSAVLLGFNFGAANGLQASSAATDVGTGVQSTNLTRGSGSTCTTNGGIPISDCLNVLDGTPNGAWNHADLAAAKAANAYLEWTLTPSTGYSARLTTLQVATYRQYSSGAATLEAEYSFDGFATPGMAIGTITSIQSTPTSHVLSLSGISALQSATSPVTFRLWAYGFDYWEIKGLGQVAGNDLTILGSLDGLPSTTAFTRQPSNTTSTTGISPAITVEIQDDWGNRVANSTASVTLAIGTNPGSGTLSGAHIVSAVGGVATFPGLSIDKIGTGYTLTASSSGLTGDTSSAFDITLGTAGKLAFLQHPTAAASTLGIGPDITVQIQDAGGNPVSGSTSSVTLAIGTNPGAGTLAGTATVNAVAGVATFPGLSIDKIGTGYTLTASSSGLTGATSSAFNITLGAANKLAFLQQPTTAVSTASIAPAITVQIQDAGGNVVTGSTAAVTLAIGTNPGSGTLSGSVTVDAVAGVATLTGLSIDQIGTGYTLVASSGALTGVTSSAFNITLGTAHKLVFLQQPTTAASTASIAPAISVQIQDAGGNVATGSAAAVTLTISANPGSGTLSGTVTINAVAGVATFAGLSIDASGTGYTLAATSAGLIGVTSSPFDILMNTLLLSTDVSSECGVGGLMSLLLAVMGLAGMRWRRI